MTEAREKNPGSAGILWNVREAIKMFLCNERGAIGDQGETDTTDDNSG